jgi:hypothetical protein
MKTSKKIRRELERHSDFAVAFGDAIEALEWCERNSITFRRGKSSKKPTSHKKRRNLSMKFSDYVRGNLVGNLPLRKRKLPTRSDESE